MSKKNKTILNIKGAVLDNEQLQTYMEKMASNHEVESYSDIETYPIYRLDSNFEFIEKTYALLNEHIKKQIDIHPAGEWLLDNFYVIEESYKKIKKDMTMKKYKSLPKISNGMYAGYARIYVIAAEIVAYTDGKINDDVLSLALFAYEKKKSLSMGEIWDLWIFLNIAIIENIRNICEKIYSSQIQKYKVEGIVERLIEKKESTNQSFKPVKYDVSIANKDMKYPFIEYMSYKLKKYGKQGIAYLDILEEQVNKMGLTVSEVIKKEHFDIAIQKVSIGNSITSIRQINRINFLDIFEKVNGVEEILKQDPARVYEKMDYSTKEYYRNSIKELAKKTKMSEVYIAKKALEMSHTSLNEKIDKKSHIGYYLIDEGKKNLIKSLEEIQTNNYEDSSSNAYTKKSKRYINSIYLLSFIFSVLFASLMYKITNNIVISLVLLALSFVPISEIYIQILNYILGKKTKPKLIPKLDLSKGIPEEYSTMVVIPTIVKNEEKVKELFSKLEVYYLANKSDNIFFSVLGDASASNNENEDFDEIVAQAGTKEAERLNEKYAKNQKPKFYFIYRKRKWNPSEKCYLGWERKRGLLCEFNNFLINGIDNFRINTFKQKLDIKYVITLDADTNLVLDSAASLIGAMAHILNQPVIDANKNIVVEGHALIQPRVGIDLISSRKSLFTKIYAGARRNRLIYKCNFRCLSR